MSAITCSRFPTPHYDSLRKVLLDRRRRWLQEARGTRTVRVGDRAEDNSLTMRMAQPAQVQQDRMARCRQVRANANLLRQLRRYWPDRRVWFGCSIRAVNRSLAGSKSVLPMVLRPKLAKAVCRKARWSLPVKPYPAPISRKAAKVLLQALVVLREVAGRLQAAGGASHRNPRGSYRLSKARGG